MPYPSPFVESKKPGIIECKKALKPELHSALARPGSAHWHIPNIAG